MGKNDLIQKFVKDALEKISLKVNGKNISKEMTINIQTMKTLKKQIIEMVNSNLKQLKSMKLYAMNQIKK